MTASWRASRSRSQKRTPANRQLLHRVSRRSSSNSASASIAVADLGNHRRYCFLKYRDAVALEDDMETVWDAKRRAMPGTVLTSGFPARPALLAAGYLAEEELEGADETELLNAGLTQAQAAAVLAAIG